MKEKTRKLSSAALGGASLTLSLLILYVVLTKEISIFALPAVILLLVVGYCSLEYAFRGVKNE